MVRKSLPRSVSCIGKGLLAGRCALRSFAASHRHLVVNSVPSMIGVTGLINVFLLPLRSTPKQANQNPCINMYVFFCGTCFWPQKERACRDTAVPFIIRGFVNFWRGPRYDSVKSTSKSELLTCLKPFYKTVMPTIVPFLAF